MSFASAPLNREQMVLFSTRLDDVLPPDHTIRLFHDILGRMDWTSWEAVYHGQLGQPPIHPRVLAGVILYGLLTKIRSSRGLEEAVRVRLDFLWLVEGQTLDHSTLSKFRKKHAVPLKHLFVQIGLLARELGWLPLQTLAYDGTRLKSNNRRTGTRTPAELREMQRELEQKFEELQAQADTEDAQDQEVFGSGNGHTLPEALSHTQNRIQEVDRALEELARVAAAGETTPKRIPLTDPQSRLTPNKEGGFAPNYTPLATVDAFSGLIVATDVIAMTNDESQVVAQVKQVQEDFQLPGPSPELLGDGAMGTGPNLAALEGLNVTLYSPLPGKNWPENPALRADPTQPVPQELWDQLPTRTVRPTGGQKQPQLDKEAFVYVAEEDCYRCPQGEKLSRSHTSCHTQQGQVVERTCYKAPPAVCAECPLRKLCLQETAEKTQVNGRQVSRDQFDSQRERLDERMQTPEAQEKYSRRREVAERPFATIKQQFGARQFLLRGLANVRVEWQWLTLAFNLHRLMALLRARPGPAPSVLLSAPHPV
jgi:transposase